MKVQAASDALPVSRWTKSKSMRTVISVFAALVCTMFLAQPAYPRNASLLPGELTCEYRINPLGIDSHYPRFAWTLSSNSRNQVQTAYEIIVSDIAQGNGNIWTSGKTVSSGQNQIVFGGAPLKPFTRYYWKVRVYDGLGQRSSWSDEAWFETAMLSQGDWTSQWISDGSRNPDRDADYYGEDRMPLLRRKFNVRAPVSAARLYISGLGYYEAYLNGKKIGDRMLDPGWTTYRKQVLYSVFDITGMINNGDNVAGIMLGNGWWNPLPFKLFGRWDLRDFQETGRPCVRAEIHLYYSDGSKQIIPTNEEWLATPGPIVKNNVYLGEHYDARLEVANWSTSEASPGNWVDAVAVAGPQGELLAQMLPPIKVTKVIRPVRIIGRGDGVFIADMGQNFAGVVRINVKGRAGTRVTLRFGEGLFEDGSLNVMTTVATQIKKGGIKGGAGAPETAWQEDSYTLKGNGTETWAPRFTFHGFRYVEITGWPGKPTVDDIEGLRMNSDLQPLGTFACSNPMFNRLHETVQWTFLSNVFSVQSDCPGREKMGYGADIVVTANAFMFNYDMAQFYRKTVNDYRNEQRPLGGMTEIAPFTGIADRGYGDLSGPLGWQLVFPYLQKQLYLFYGDTRIIEENYSALQKQIAFLRSQSKENLFYWDISDHEAIDPRPEALTASAFYYHHALLASELAGILGKKEDSLGYRQLSQRIGESLVRKFHVPGTGRFDNATQSAQLFSIWYDLAPDREKSMEVFYNELDRHDHHLSTGIFSTWMFFDVMRESNRNDVAYRVANQRNFPGWGYMLGRGATTLWESWDFPETVPSRNHPMFGSVDEWFYRSLLGINPSKPGFAEVIIKPQPAGDLTWARGGYHSIRGPITSNWKIEDDIFYLQVEIPPNTTARVWLPSVKGGEVLEDGRTLDGVKFNGGYAMVEVGSGSYSFQSRIN